MNLWVEKYRPSSIDDYVFRDDIQKKQVKAWLEEESLPHLLFSGVQGSGKTTLAKVLLNEMGVEKSDILIMNGSVENGVEEVKTKTSNFATMMGFGGMRYILIDEADYLSPNAQGALRHIIEQYTNYCRFIFTCNYKHRIIPAIHSRCQGFDITKLDQTEFTARVAEIVITEGVEITDLDILDTYVSSTYPDMRKCINLCQQNSSTGTLLPPEESDSGDSDYKLQMVTLFKENKFREARKLICSQIRTEEYEDMFRFMYRNLHFWANNDPLKEDQAIVIIRNGLVKHVSCGDPEINLSATFAELQTLSD